MSGRRPPQAPENENKRLRARVTELTLANGALERRLAEAQRATDEGQRTAEERLHQAQRLEAIGRLAGGVAHDFNNLLTAIIGHADVAIGRLDPLDPNLESLTRIRRAGRRGASLAGQLLAFGQRQMLQKRLVDLNRVACDCGPLLQGQLGPGVDLVYDLADSLPGVMADSSQLEQVLVNLVTNAGEAMPDGGTVTVASRALVCGPDQAATPNETRPGQYVSLSVSDTGEGMTPETTAAIFEPFFTTRKECNGLGLSVVHGIVKQHGGRVDVETAIGRGTTFTIFLPAGEFSGQRAEDVSFVPLNSLSGQGECVLVIEDEEALLELAATLLTDNGYRVLTASSVQTALALYEAEPERVDAVFSDVVLPDGTGVEIVTRLLARRPDLPVVMTSGYADQRSQWRIIDERDLPFLSKPYSPTDLLLTLRDALHAARP